MSSWEKMKRLLVWLWPTLFGPPPEPVTIQEADRVYLPPEPMFKAPDEDEWQPL